MTIPSVTSVKDGLAVVATVLAILGALNVRRAWLHHRRERRLRELQRQAQLVSLIGLGALGKAVISRPCFSGQPCLPPSDHADRTLAVVISDAERLAAQMAPLIKMQSADGGIPDAGVAVSILLLAKGF